MKSIIIIPAMIVCFIVAAISTTYASTLVHPGMAPAVTPAPSAGPSGVTATLAVTEAAMACADIDPGLWKGYLLPPDATTQPLQQLGDPMVQAPPGGVVPMPNACLPQPTSPVIPTKLVRTVNTAAP